MADDHLARLEAIDKMTTRERSVMVARMEVELLRPTRDYHWPEAWQKIDAPQKVGPKAKTPRKAPAVVRSKAPKSEPSTKPLPPIGPFVPIWRKSASMPFERFPVTSQDDARTRAAEAM